MTKPINFTCKEKLKSLLDKSCGQTLRRAWEEWINGKGLDGIRPKPAAYKVGDIVSFIWNRDSLWDWFCKKTGRAICGINHPRNDSFLNWFNKNLGKVKITEVFMVEMGKEDNSELNKDGKKSKNDYYLQHGMGDSPVNQCKVIAKKDGFKSAESFFKYFNDNYDLSQPRKFWVYRFEWLGDEE